MSVWDNQYDDDEPDGYGADPDPDDPQGDLRRDRDAEVDARGTPPTPDEPPRAPSDKLAQGATGPTPPTDAPG